MTDSVIKINIVIQIAVQVAEEGQERRQTDAARDPDLFAPTRLVIEHAVGALDDRVHARFQFLEKVAGEVPAGFDGEARWRW